MKKLLFVLSLIFTLSYSSYAQFSIGGQTGVSVSNMYIKGDGSLIPDPQNFIGINTGLIAAYQLTPLLSLESGLLYHRTGFQAKQSFDFDVYNIPIEANLKAIPQFGYLELPGTLNFNFGNSKVIAKVGVGPYAAYALDGKVKTKAHFLVDFNIATIDLNLSNSLYNRWDAGLKTQAGLEFPINKFSLAIGADFQHSLVDFTNEPLLDIKTKRYAYGANAGLKYNF